MYLWTHIYIVVFYGRVSVFVYFESASLCVYMCMCVCLCICKYICFNLYVISLKCERMYLYLYLCMFYRHANVYIHNMFM